MLKGYLQVYTGDGKGKTTAAYGLALRALGAGFKVHILQFVKNMRYGEQRLLADMGVPIESFGRGCFIMGPPEAEDRAIAEAGLERVLALFEGKACDLLILDEFHLLSALKLCPEAALLKTLAARPESMEVVTTGRGAPPALQDLADLVTEMHEQKHYYQVGVEAREGIER